MATFRHIPTGKRFYFVHIPRTAGRFIETNLMVNNNFAWDDDWEKFGINQVYQKYDGIEFGHWHREYYEKYLDVDDIPHVSIVRNPIDRFFSASIFLKRMYGECQEEMEDTMMFYSMLDNFPLSEGINWFRSQLDFISEETNVWRFEDGFGIDFNKWMSQILGVEFQVKDVPYKELTTNESNKLERSAKLLHNVGNLYRKDIEQFYPELAA